MNFKDLMAADTAMMLGADEHDEAATYGTDTGAAFACRVVVGDGQPDVVAGMGVSDLQSQVTLLAMATVISTGIETVEGAARDPRPGETVTVGAAVYVIETWTTDAGGGLSLRCRRSDGAVVGGARRIAP
jgi:tetrahydromethanopterin S-methyltransferase subunit C